MIHFYILLCDIFFIQKGKNQLSFYGVSQLKRQRKDAQGHNFWAFQAFRIFAVLTLPFQLRRYNSPIKADFRLPLPQKNVFLEGGDFLFVLFEALCFLQIFIRCHIINPCMRPFFIIIIYEFFQFPTFSHNRIFFTKSIKFFS